MVIIVLGSSVRGQLSGPRILDRPRRRPCTSGEFGHVPHCPSAPRIADRRRGAALCGSVRICAGGRSKRMTSTTDKVLTDGESRTIAAAVREEIARRRISRQYLADMARISISTLEKALSDRRPFTLATTIRLEEALGRKLRRSEIPEQRPDALRKPCAGRARLLFAAGSVLDRRQLSDAPALLRRPDRHLRLSHRDRLGRGARRARLSRGRAPRHGVHAGRLRVGAQPVGPYLPRHQPPRAASPDHAGAPDRSVAPCTAS